MSEVEKIYINGIDGETGEYLLDPLEYSQAAKYVRGEQVNKPLIGLLERIWKTLRQPHLGLPLDVDPVKVSQAGWGIIFHKDEEQPIRDALTPLVDHRRHQVQDGQRVKILDYQTGENNTAWLARQGIGAGSVEPTKVPYYLLIIGSPEKIPFEFGHHLGVEYAVGRLHFETPDEYAIYVTSLIDYETRETIPNAREVVFFGTRHPLDRATQMSADYLLSPLADGTPESDTGPSTPGIAEKWQFQYRKIEPEQATKAALSEVFNSPAGRKPPALLFAAAHGMGWKMNHPKQRSDQGAILCQDWPGFGTMHPDHYFSAADLPETANIHGLITFLFTCYGAGTPSHDRFIREPGKPPRQISEESFFAALPKALLTHSGGGALACIGHVERAWGYSYITPKAGPQLLPFQNTIGRILIGQPVGYAMKDFQERYAALSTSLSATLEEIEFGKSVPDEELAANWIARNDAEGYILIGDPAVCLRADEIV